MGWTQHVKHLQTLGPGPKLDPGAQELDPWAELIPGQNIAGCRGRSCLLLAQEAPCFSAEPGPSLETAREGGCKQREPRAFRSTAQEPEVENKGDKVPWVSFPECYEENHLHCKRIGVIRRTLEKRLVFDSNFSPGPHNRCRS